MYWGWGFRLPIIQNQMRKEDEHQMAAEFIYRFRRIIQTKRPLRKNQMFWKS